MEKEKKHWVYLMDSILIVVTVLSLFGIFAYKGSEITGLITGPVLNSPENGTVISQSILFSFSYGELLLIDENLNFSHPREFNVEDNVQITLEPGVYYWKVEGSNSKFSEIREFTIQSRVELKLRKVGDEYEVVNAGNNKLNVDVYELGQLTGKMILNVDESSKANSNSTKFIGGQAD